MTPESHRRVLLVDDDTAVLQSSSMLLSRAGFTVDSVASAEEAIALLGSRTYSAILSDINMDGMSGLDLLKAIRERDLDTPVILITGGPSLQTAIDAMAWGAHRYLLKPVGPRELIEAITRAVLLADLARLKREAFALRGSRTLPVDDEQALHEGFSRALAKLTMVFHPIVSLKEQRAVGFEALVRSTEPTLEHPEALLGTASLLGRHEELTRSIYERIAARATDLPDEALLFVNVHPPDLLNPSLHGIGSPLAPYADRVILEITERASIEKMGDITDIVRDLRLLKYRLAVDDLGTGYAGLSSFTQLSPEFVKLDRSLVDGIDRNPTKQRVVKAMTTLCADLGMRVISEGIETKAECETLTGLGADLLQGYLFGRPSPGFWDPTF
ncbi:MAG: EAL domain-containing protein [Gemmatimonadaceae bacterium]|nr:EAL domain-containing protein [Gemmatimonadaceae bacterium]